jgi:hypothetical protein
MQAMVAENINLQELSCDYLEIEIHFSSDQFNEALFRESVSKHADRRGRLSVTCKSKNYPGKQHAHIRAEIRSNEPSMVSVFYTIGSEGKAPTAPQDIEDCLQWLAGFFTVKNVEAKLDGAFTFSEEYSFVAPLPFPPPSVHPVLSRALVTGVALEFPERPDLDRVIIQRVGKTIGVQPEARIRLNLPTVNAVAIIRDLYNVARSFVTTKEDGAR